MLERQRAEKIKQDSGGQIAQRPTQYDAQKWRKNIKIKKKGGHRPSGVYRMKRGRVKGLS